MSGLNNAVCWLDWAETKVEDEWGGGGGGGGGGGVAQCKDTHLYYLTVLWKACKLGIPRIKTRGSVCTWEFKHTGVHMHSVHTPRQGLPIMHDIRWCRRTCVTNAHNPKSIHNMNRLCMCLCVCVCGTRQECHACHFGVTLCVFHDIWNSPLHSRKVNVGARRRKQGSIIMCVWVWACHQREKLRRYIWFAAAEPAFSGSLRCTCWYAHVSVNRYLGMNATSEGTEQDFGVLVSVFFRLVVGQIVSSRRVWADFGCMEVNGQYGEQNRGKALAKIQFWNQSAVVWQNVAFY